MSSDDIPQNEGPVTDPEELERLMKLGFDNPALQGPMFRLLLGARLWVMPTGTEVAVASARVVCIKGQADSASSGGPIVPHPGVPWRTRGQA